MQINKEQLFHKTNG